MSFFVFGCHQEWAVPRVEGSHKGGYDFKGCVWRLHLGLGRSFELMERCKSLNEGAFFGKFHPF